VLLTKELEEDIVELTNQGYTVLEEIKDALISENIPVIDIEMYERRARKRNKSLTILKLTIKSRNPPETIHLGQEVLKCEQVIDKPRQCQKCWKFGHPQKYCRNENVCVICWSKDHNIDCCPSKGDKNKPKTCLNCKEPT
uniref:hypothetical protein n=1 Tax=Klebsiella pneumoniae TaxID=573 RepID=UPI003EBA9538